jgi:hypothetical protein
MRIAFVIDNISDEPGFLHPISVFSEMRLPPEYLCLSDEDFVERHVRPLVHAAKTRFFQMQEDASARPPLT